MKKLFFLIISPKNPQFNFNPEITIYKYLSRAQTQRIERARTMILDETGKTGAPTFTL